MNRKTFRYILLGLLLLSAGFATWSWLRPYEWSADSGARCRIVGCEVTRDHANYWVNLQLKITGNAEHDLTQLVQLVVADGQTLEAADTTLEGDKEMPVTIIWLKFWLDEAHMNGPLSLKINDGELTVRSGKGLPKLRSDGSRYFVTHNW